MPGCGTDARWPDSRRVGSRTRHTVCLHSATGEPGGPPFSRGGGDATAGAVTVVINSCFPNGDEPSWHAPRVQEPCTAEKPSHDSREARSAPPDAEQAGWRIDLNIDPIEPSATGSASVTWGQTIAKTAVGCHSPFSPWPRRRRMSTSLPGRDRGRLAIFDHPVIARGSIQSALMTSPRPGRSPCVRFDLRSHENRPLSVIRGNRHDFSRVSEWRG